MGEAAVDPEVGRAYLHAEPSEGLATATRRAPQPHFMLVPSLVCPASCFRYLCYGEIPQHDLAAVPTGCEGVDHRALHLAGAAQSCAASIACKEGGAPCSSG